MRSLNLATRPFRNERLPRLALRVSAVALAGITLWHAVLVNRVLPGRTTALHGEVEALAKKAAALRAEARNVERARPAPAEVAHWSALKELVDRRSFSWTDLFAVLEDVLPGDVRLVSIAPAPEKGEVKLTLSAVTRSYEDGIRFIRVLEERPEFSDVLPVSRGGDSSDGTDFQYRVTYRPSAALRAAPAPAGPAGEQPQEPLAQEARR